MKKSISVILVLVIALSVFSFGASAADTRTQALFDAFEEDEEITVTFRTGKGKTFGEAYSSVNTVYIDGEDIAYDFDNGYFRLRTMVDDGKVVSFLPTFPYIHMTVFNLPFVEVDIFGIVNKLSDFTMEFLVFQNSYETTIDGVTYYVEEFNDRDSVVNSFYYVDDDLKVLKAHDTKKNTVQYTYFDEITFDADKSVFKRPIVSLELTVVLTFLLTLLAGMPIVPVA